MVQRGCVLHHLFDVIAEDGAVVGPIRTWAPHAAEACCAAAGTKVSHHQPAASTRPPASQHHPPGPRAGGGGIAGVDIDDAVRGAPSPNLVDSMGQLSAPPGLQLVPPALPLLVVPKSSGVRKAFGSTSVGFWQLAIR